MMLNEERIKELHLRAVRIKRKNDMIRTAVYGVTSLMLMVTLIALMITQGSSQSSMNTGQFTGTSMLDASVGGYVLVALISFAVAVAFTLLCIRWKQKNDQRDGPVNQRDGSVIETDKRDNSVDENDPQGESMTADRVQSVDLKNESQIFDKGS